MWLRLEEEGESSGEDGESSDGKRGGSRSGSSGSGSGASGSGGGRGSGGGDGGGGGTLSERNQHSFGKVTIGNSRSSGVGGGVNEDAVDDVNDTVSAKRNVFSDGKH